MKKVILLFSISVVIMLMVMNNNSLFAISPLPYVSVLNMPTYSTATLSNTPIAIPMDMSTPTVEAHNTEWKLDYSWYIDAGIACDMWTDGYRIVRIECP